MNEITYKTEQNRIAAYDGEKLIGECDWWEFDGGARDLYHTEVDPAYRGRKIAEKLVELAAEEAEKANARLRCSCSYAAHVIGRRK